MLTLISIDYICVYSPTSWDHFCDLWRTLEAFREANVQLRRAICKLGMHKGEFVRHVIAASGHRPLPSLVYKSSIAARFGNSKELQMSRFSQPLYREYNTTSILFVKWLYIMNRDNYVWSWENSKNWTLSFLECELIFYIMTQTFAKICMFGWKYA